MTKTETIGDVRVTVNVRGVDFFDSKTGKMLILFNDQEASQLLRFLTTNFRTDCVLRGCPHADV